MPEFDQFIKQFNNIIPAPTTAYPFGFPVVYESSNSVHNHSSNNIGGGGGSTNDYYIPKNVALPTLNNSVASTEVNVISCDDLVFFARLAENTWRQLIMSDILIRENSSSNSGGGGGSNAVSNMKTVAGTSAYYFPKKNNSAANYYNNNDNINANGSNNNNNNINSGNTNTSNLVTSTSVSSPTGTGSTGYSLNTNHVGSPIVIGKMTVSTEDRWRLQAQMRRDETRSGNTRREYNKKVTRATMITKGPEGDGFPVGRGKPV